MARYLSTDTLIDSVKRRAMLPETNVTFTEDDFLAFAIEELDMALIPYVMSSHEDYFLYTEIIPFVQGQNRYEIPYRAVGNKLREVAFQDDNGNVMEMTRILVEDVPFYQGFGSGSGILKVFYLEGNEIVLFPEVAFNGTGSLRISYYLRPNQLVNEDRVMNVLAVDFNNNTITVDAIPDFINVASKLDQIALKAPNKCYAIDITPIAIDTTNNVITFNPGDISPKMRPGDMVALAEECKIPQIPLDLHSMLAQRIACRCLEALGDATGLQAANAKLAEMELKGMTLIDSRVEGAPLKVNNRHTFLRQSRRQFRR